MEDAAVRMSLWLARALSAVLIGVSVGHAIEPLPCPMIDCDDSAYEGVRTFRGVYRTGFENSTFIPRGSQCRWWMIGAEGGTLERTLERHWPYLVASVEMSVEGTLSAAGCYGHMGVARRELRVTKIRSFRIVDVVRFPKESSKAADDDE